MSVCVKCKAELPANANFCPACGKKQTSAPRKARKRANNTGTVYRMSGRRAKPWAAQKNRVFIGSYPTREEATKALERLTDTEITRGYNLTFRQVYERWKPEHARKLSASGLAGYTAAYTHCAALYDLPFRKLRTSDFQAVVTALEESGKSKSTCEKVVQLFGQLSKWAIREGVAATNYAQFVTILATQKSTRTPFTEAQIAAIQRSKLPAAQIALILLGTGCRPNELFSAATDNCQNAFFVSGSKTDAGRNRVIPVCPIGMEAYTSLLHAARKNNHRKLIDAYTGNKIAANFAKRDFKALMEEIGCTDMTPYHCRHTFTTLAVKAGVKPEILQKILGHADYSTTVGVYTHFGKEDILAAAQSIDVTSKLQANKKAARNPAAKSS